MFPNFFRLPNNYIVQENGGWGSKFKMASPSQVVPTEQMNWMQKVWALTTLRFSKKAVHKAVTIKTGFKGAPVEHPVVNAHSERVLLTKSDVVPDADFTVYSLTPGT